MLALERTKTYKKDIRKVRFTNQQYAKYILYISYLLDKNPLPPEALDHSLKGQWSGFREFHIGGDLLVIYTVSDHTLYLTRIGTHNELFSN